MFGIIIRSKKVYDVEIELSNKNQVTLFLFGSFYKMAKINLTIGKTLKNYSNFALKLQLT